jgi:hypothetical protein
MAKIEYENKVTFTSSQLPEINKCTAPNLNEIKESVNWLYDNVIPEPVPSDPIPVTTVLLATVGNLSYNPIYDNGVDGVGATLTATANGVLRDTSGVGLIDGSSDFENGDTILIKNRPNQEENGIFLIIDKGSPSTQYELERTAEYNEGAEFYPLQVNVILGNTNGDKIFLQQTENVEIGVSDIVFELVETPNPIRQIRYIDTATSEPLPAFTYNPTTKIFTADEVGYLGTINGLFATTNPNIEGGFTTFLVKDEETSPEFNGSMQILNTGSSTTYAQWIRLDTIASQFIYRGRTFMVSKVGSTLYGKQYFVQPNTPALTTAQINTEPINFFEVNSQTLQNILDFNHDLVDGNNFQGTGAGNENEGTNINAFGQDAGSSNLGDGANFLGKGAGKDNSGDNVNAFGDEAGLNNSGIYVNAIGFRSALDNTGYNVNAFGPNSAQSNSGNNVNAFGDSAGQGNTLEGQTIFSGLAIPIHANRLTAEAYYVTANGASLDSAYMYFDDTLKVLSCVFVTV